MPQKKFSYGGGVGAQWEAKKEEHVDWTKLQRPPCFPNMEGFKMCHLLKLCHVLKLIVFQRTRDTYTTLRCEQQEHALRKTDHGSK